MKFTTHRWILIVFFALGVVYSLVVPPFEASDELWHYPMVKYIADHWALPVQVPGEETPWRQEGSQPPLYYLIGAGATFWINTADMDTVRHLNPHVDNGVATPDGNVNLVVHDPAREAFPWRGTVLAIHIVRLISVTLGTLAVYLTYRIGQAVCPDRPELAWGAAAVQAFTPMVVFIAGAVNNDNLAIPLFSLTLLMLIRLAEQETWSTSRAARQYLALGSVLGLAALTKLGWPALAALTALVVGIRAARRRSWGEFFLGGVATLLPLLLIAGWWYLRNWRLYGDPLGLNVFKVILGTREVPADLAQLWRERHSFMAGYWGNFGGLNLPMPAWVYAALDVLTGGALLGLVVGGIRRIVTREKREGLPVATLPFVLCLLWGAGVILPWALSWARDTWSSQGRLIFSALPVWSLLLVLGWSGWFPARWGREAVAGPVLFLLTLAVIAPWAWIRPAYAPPEALSEAAVATIPRPVEVDFGGTMRLLGVALESDDHAPVFPGDDVAVTLYWEALAPADRDYTVFVHLLGEGERPVAQRDTFPGLGRLSTRTLTPGMRWADRYVLRLPETTYAPDHAQIEVGVYDRTTGARLPVRGTGLASSEATADNVRFGRVEIRRRTADVPNPLTIRFDDHLALVGYDLDRVAVAPGGAITVTLYWQGLRPMEENYNFSVQLIDAAQRKAAQWDGWPQEGAAPTTIWEPGQTVVDPHRLSIAPDVLPGVYELRVTVYALRQVEGERGDVEMTIHHLPVTPLDGRMQSKQITLTTVRVRSP